VEGVKLMKLTCEYVIAGPAGDAKQWRAEDFWKMAFDPAHKDNRPDMGYLISQYDFEDNWRNWECHPHGDEVVLCLKGQITFILENDDVHTEHLLVAGEYLIVPKATWHTANVQEPSQVLFVTWGYETAHRNR
jgi:mannose-6-phosphate isomerase-like protein (cupin superfamily)